MAAKYYRDPAIRKLLEVKAEAISLGLPESIITGLQSVEDLHNVSCTQQIIYSCSKIFHCFFTTSQHYIFPFKFIYCCSLALH